MIRFIDLRGQETGARFAFFDTVTDSFIGPPSWQTWDTEAELRIDLQGDPRLERMAGLLPDWARVPEAEPTIDEALERADIP